MAPPVSGLTLLGAYFVALWLVSRARSQPVASRAAQLFRALWPSWRLFEDLDDALILMARSAADGAALGDWQRCLPPRTRRWSTLLLNAEGNHRLACNSLVQQLVSDLSEMDETRTDLIVDSVSYRLVRNLVAVNCAPGERFQFKVCALRAGAPLSEMEDLIVSPVHEA